MLPKILDCVSVLCTMYAIQETRLPLWGSDCWLLFYCFMVTVCTILVVPHKDLLDENIAHRTMDETYKGEKHCELISRFIIKSSGNLPKIRQVTIYCLRFGHFSAHFFPQLDPSGGQRKQWNPRERKWIYGKTKIPPKNMRGYPNIFQLFLFQVCGGFITTTWDCNSPKETGNPVQELQQKKASWWPRRSP